ncbi:MAG: PQQ-binding-like beta-propeller repeat protein [Candidatus Aenigmarchaeota archaeon]|nr:PQQ-binding-like beta-propeller repeat protein [Candidatus Aenigmarchaeota archaeon]
MDFGFESFDSTFSDFDVDVEEITVKKKGTYDRIWRTTKGGSIDNNPLLYKGVIYFGAQDCYLYAVDEHSGKVLWTFKANDMILGSSPVLYKESVVFGSYDFNVYRIDLETHEPVWIFKTSGEVFSCPYVYENKIYIGSRDSNVYCLDGESGKEIWRFKTGAEVYCIGPSLVKDGIVYFGSFDNNMYALRTEDGSEVWRVRLGKYGIAAGPELYNDVLLQQTRDGILFAITLDGKIKWRFKTEVLVGVPTVDYKNDMIYVSSEDTHVYCLDNMGNMIWKTKTGGPVFWKPALYGNKVFVSSWDCKIYVLDKHNGEILSTFNTSSSQQAFMPDFKEGFRAEIRHDTHIEESITEDKYKSKNEASVSLSNYQLKSEYATTSEYKQKSDYDTSLVMFEEVMEEEIIWISDLSQLRPQTSTWTLKK